MSYNGVIPGAINPVTWGAAGAWAASDSKGLTDC